MQGNPFQPIVEQYVNLLWHDIQNRILNLLFPHHTAHEPGGGDSLNYNLSYLQDCSIDPDTLNSAPANTQVLTWNGTAWVPETAGSGGAITVEDNGSPQTVIQSVTTLQVPAGSLSGTSPTAIIAWGGVTDMLNYIQVSIMVEVVNGVAPTAPVNLTPDPNGLTLIAWQMTSDPGVVVKLLNAYSGSGGAAASASSGAFASLGNWASNGSLYTLGSPTEDGTVYINALFVGQSASQYLFLHPNG